MLSKVLRQSAPLAVPHPNIGKPWSAWRAAQPSCFIVVTWSASAGVSDVTHGRMRIAERLVERGHACEDPLLDGRELRLGERRDPSFMGIAAWDLNAS